MLNLLFTSSVSACIECVNDKPYFSEAPYDVTLNGKTVLRSIDTNVFSLFDLEPDTEYTASTPYGEISFTTKAESACFNVRDFFAQGNGVTDDTDAIQAAIDCCPDYGRVFLPAGAYKSRPITLRSHITLEVKLGAVFLADDRMDVYPLLPGEIRDNRGAMRQISSWEGVPVPCRKSIFSAHYAEDITITGQGTVDGAGGTAGWWVNPKQHKAGRSRLMFFAHCRNVTVHGIHGANSPSWHFHPYFCRDVSFLDMSISAPKDSPNTDGINPESCGGVRIIGVRFSVGDDAIAIKSGKMYMGMTYKTPASRHTIRNCLMEFAHGAVVLGSEMSGGVKELNVSQCVFRNTDRGLRIKTRRGRGKYGVIDGVVFSNIEMDGVLTPIVINMFYFCDPDGHEEIVWSKEKHPIDDSTPRLGAFTFKNITCRNCEWAAAYCYGLPERPIEEITLENVSFAFRENASSGHSAMMDFVPECCREGLHMHNVGLISLKNVHIEGHTGDRLILDNVREVSAEWI